MIRTRSVMAFLIMFASANVFCQTPTALDVAAWETLNKRIVDAYKGLDPNAPAILAIQMITIPKALPTDDAEAFKAAYLDIADTIPKWSPTWTPSSRFSDTYRLFAESVAVPQRTDVNPTEYAAASKKYLATTDKKRADYRAVLVEWNNYRITQIAASQNVLPWNLWTNNISAKASAWQQAEGDRLTAQAAMFNLYDPGARVIGSFKERMINFSFDPQNDIVENTERYPYNYASARAALLQLAVDAKANAAANTPMFSWDSSRDTSHRKEESSSWGASASYQPFGGLYGGSASANGTHYSLNLSTGGAAVSIQAFGFSRVTILPGAWWAPTLVPWYKKNNGTLLPNAPLNENTGLWGADGILNLRPVEMLVMIRPTLTAKLTKSDYTRVVDTLSAGGGVSFGPFSFGGRYSKSTETIDKDEQKGTITFTNKSDTPYVIAVISERL